MRPRQRSYVDLAVAAVLFVGATVAVAATNDMGFVRDEAFYFRHSETYQDWFTEVLKGGKERDKALTRAEIARTWRNNAEHPPLHKIMMGVTWRTFGRKLRDVGTYSERGGEVVATLTGLGKSHGFDKGTRVQLLRPQVVGESPDPAGRELATGVVTARDVWRATVRLDVDGTAKGLLKKLGDVCRHAGPGDDGKIRRTGCEAYEIDALHIMSESSAMRFPGALSAALVVILIFGAARGWFVSAAAARPLPMPFALLAGAGFLLLPRPFYHAHLACFDMSICALLLFTTVAYARSLRSKTWMFIVALLWGLSLLGKHNAAFLPIPFIFHWAWDALAEGRIRLTLTTGWRRWAALGAAALLLVGGALIHPLLGLGLAALALASRKNTLHLPPLPAAWFAMLPIGLVVLVLGWPLLWYDTFEHFLRWLEFHLSHEHYMQQYFGAILAYPPFPWGFPWMMTTLTWPVALLLACAVGTVVIVGGGLRFQWQRLRGTRDEQDEPGDAEWRGWWRLILLSSFWPSMLISMPSTPVFGGIKHWMPAYPFMLLLAAAGAHFVWRSLRDGLLIPRPAAVVLAWVLALMIAAPAAQATWEVHPHGTAYYNELIGGAPGAADAGMQRQFWGGATREGLAAVNLRAKRGARVWFHKCAWGAYMMYQREGWFRRDLGYGHAPAGTTHGFYHHQKDHDDYELEAMADYGVSAPVMRASLEGVPLLSVYERPR